MYCKRFVPMFVVSGLALSPFQQQGGDVVSWLAWVVAGIVIAALIILIGRMLEGRQTAINAKKIPTPVTVRPVGKPDDLTKIEGIGPKIAGALNRAGVMTFDQLAHMDTTKIKTILDKAELRLGDPDTWPRQAELAAEGQWDKLHVLQDNLKGGRRI